MLGYAAQDGARKKQTRGREARVKPSCATRHFGCRIRLRYRGAGRPAGGLPSGRMRRYISRLPAGALDTRVGSRNKKCRVSRLGSTRPTKINPTNSNRLLRLECGDLALLETELGQDLVGVLAFLRQRADDLSRRPRQGHRPPDQFDPEPTAGLPSARVEGELRSASGMTREALAKFHSSRDVPESQREHIRI